MATILINQTFDDRDTADLHYAGEWPSPQDGSYNASNVGQTGTLSSTEDIRANVTFTFPIPANAVYYYGIRRCCGGLYAICVDCDPNNPIFETIDAVNSTDDGKNPPVILWSKTFDTFGIHAIILTNQNDSRFGHSQITIDRFELQVLNTDPVVTTLVSEPLATTSTASSPSPTVSILAQSKAPVPIGAVIGAIVGAVVLIGFIIIMWVLYRRRRKRIRAPDDINPSSQMASIASTPRYAPTVTPTGSESFTASPLSARKYRRQIPPSSSDVDTSAASTSSSSSLAGRQRSRPFPRPRRETDAGQIPDDFSDGETLPPDYDQVFHSASRSTNRDSPRPSMPAGQFTSSAELNSDSVDILSLGKT
ncbi:MAG: hypothetical protein NXY57DRAFT_1091176 [Lentinula lateritia]|uniref:Mid2 domain-containing protein n=1 Tax=Lentinula lateritia TaxID=40482 RepID=A0ABQ8VSE7_9AGAR|nr:MAG: hypothetical protein NXY57DRAFT_1091176 [Lentinula lateritia]KAJ4499246.1 hypothetical protein C8R41DRAFT_814977 [Lentinula lateritia]